MRRRFVVGGLVLALAVSALALAGSSRKRFISSTTFGTRSQRVEHERPAERHPPDWALAATGEPIDVPRVNGPRHRRFRPSERCAHPADARQWSPTPGGDPGFIAR